MDRFNRRLSVIPGSAGGETEAAAGGVEREKRRPTCFIQFTKKRRKGKRQRGKKYISRRHGLSNASDIRALDKQDSS